MGFIKKGLQNLSKLAEQNGKNGYGIKDFGNKIVDTAEKVGSGTLKTGSGVLDAANLTGHATIKTGKLGKASVELGKTVVGDSIDIIKKSSKKYTLDDFNEDDDGFDKFFKIVVGRTLPINSAAGGIIVGGALLTNGFGVVNDAGGSKVTGATLDGSGAYNRIGRNGMTAENRKHLNLSAKFREDTLQSAKKSTVGYGIFNSYKQQGIDNFGATGDLVFAGHNNR